MSDLGVSYFLITMLASIAMLPYYVHFRKSKSDLFEPIYWASAYFFLLFVLRPLYDLILGSEFLGPLPYDQATAAAFSQGMIYAFFGFALFLVGYYSKTGIALANALPSLPTDWKASRARVVWPLLFGLGLAFHLVIVESFGGWAYYITHKSETLTIPGQGYLLLGSSMMSISFVMALTQSYRAGGRGYLAYGLLFPSLLILSFLSGSKGALLSPILTAMIATHYLKRGIRLRHIMYLVSLAIILFPILNIYRGITSDSGLLGVLGGGLQVDAEFLIRHAMARFYGIDSLTLLIRDTPQVMDYQFGGTISPLFVAWIPRQLWEDKPIISFGKIFAEEYLGEFFAGTGTSASPTLLGELYLNWHISGILVGALLSGIAIRFAYAYFIRRQFGAPAVFVYSQIFLSLFTFWEASIAGLLAGVIATLALLLALVFFAGQRDTKIKTTTIGPTNGRTHVLKEIT